MEIIYDDNYAKLGKIIENQAKYQKVILLYDDNISNVEIEKFYEIIKPFCIFNKLNVNCQNIDEIYDGYRAVIYKMSTDSFCKLNIDMSEFVNIFVPTDNGLLPYFLNNNFLYREGYLFTKSFSLDINIPTSLYFNRFYNYLNDLTTKATSDVSFDFDMQTITHLGCIKTMENAPTDLIFKDVEILKKCNLPYDCLAMIDYLLISGFYALIQSINTQILSMADIYKQAKDNNEIISKYYALTFSDSFTTLVKYNYNGLISLCEKTKEKILEFLPLNQDYDFDNIRKILKKLNEICKNDTSILNYLFLFDVFNVV